MKSICVYCGSAKLASEEYLPGRPRDGSHPCPTAADAGLRRRPHRADGRAGRQRHRQRRLGDRRDHRRHEHPRAGAHPSHPPGGDRHHPPAQGRMYELAEGYIALPGGYGTLDELFETLTWAQIGEHAKPVGLLNVNGYYDDLLRMLDRAVNEKFLFPEHRRALLVDSEPEGLLEAMEGYRTPMEAVKRWMRQE